MTGGRRNREVGECAGGQWLAVSYHSCAGVWAVDESVCPHVYLITSPLSQRRGQCQVSIGKRSWKRSTVYLPMSNGSWRVRSCERRPGESHRPLHLYNEGRLQACAASLEQASRLMMSGCWMRAGKSDLSRRTLPLAACSHQGRRRFRGRCGSISTIAV